MGFDVTGSYLLTVSHSGRGVFSVGRWELLARDRTISCLVEGEAVGIGRVKGVVIRVVQRDENKERIKIESPDDKYELIGESDGIEVLRIR